MSGPANRTGALRQSRPCRAAPAAALPARIQPTARLCLVAVGDIIAVHTGRRTIRRVLEISRAARSRNLKDCGPTLRAGNRRLLGVVRATVHETKRAITELTQGDTLGSGSTCVSGRDLLQRPISRHGPAPWRQAQTGPLALSMRDLLIHQFLRSASHCPKYEAVRDSCLVSALSITVSV